jgi:aspartyl/glutamyl-tRNA(Asn/Gln) amidotransferase C subunit
MKIGPDEVRHVAMLAELAVPETELGRLASELERIVEMVGRLGEDGDPGDPVVLGSHRLTLREDVVNPTPLRRTIAELAPEFRNGFFSVPRLGGMGEE